MYSMDFQQAMWRSTNSFEVHHWPVGESLQWYGLWHNVALGWLDVKFTCVANHPIRQQKHRIEESYVGQKTTQIHTDLTKPLSRMRVINSEISEKTSKNSALRASVITVAIPKPNHDRILHDDPA